MPLPTFASAKKSEPAPFSPFPELLIEGFDHEQVWEEIAMQNQPLLGYVVEQLDSFVAAAERDSKNSNGDMVKEDVDDDEILIGDDEILMGDDGVFDEEQEDTDDVEANGSRFIDDEAEDGEDENIDDFGLDEMDDDAIELSAFEGNLRKRELATDSEGNLEDEEDDDGDGDDDNDDDDENLDDPDLERSSTSKRPARTSQVDDAFFNLDEFNDWSERQEERDMMSEDDQEEDENEDDDIDLDEDPDKIEDEDMDDTNANGEFDFHPYSCIIKRCIPQCRCSNQSAYDTLPSDVMFSDFFEAPARPHSGVGKRNNKKSIHFSTEHYAGKRTDRKEMDVREQDQEEEQATRVSNLFAKDEDEDEADASKSAHEKNMERIKREIEALESANVGEKDWTLGGEASSKARPLNSLLEEDLEFEHVVKVKGTIYYYYYYYYGHTHLCVVQPVPVITQETTETLEEMIKRRILDLTMLTIMLTIISNVGHTMKWTFTQNAFNDVERKADPTFRPYLPSKRVELSDEKSKKSLAEIYEDDYVKETTVGGIANEKDKALKKEHQEIDNMFRDLCQKLDALSNFHYTPKPPKPEIAVISDAPAISMEEVIPVNVSDATLLAPEEVYDKKGLVKGETEMDQAERKRQRAAMKRAKKNELVLKAKARKVAEKMNPALAERQKKEKAVATLAGQKNVTFIDKDGNKRPANKKKGAQEDKKASKLKL
ncbi:LOW QUALITY PROTEIN: hypothetical protein BC938DRAFT_481943 [Jimgerdemannia flammicorona]|uniref:U3 small nucleolar ribonucleoprotein protein MPP10 n=1 Tax=Jimgerdemannia flammicorona TaxID=994334 RepID=A0A433QF16_9FUNG|nr:LOW QUALITY PROTEIN: hypothetical protein BC938DRAFT_481943 [Jimgerdemannia flammicorona]